MKLNSKSVDLKKRNFIEMNEKVYLHNEKSNIKTGNLNSGGKIQRQRWGLT